jgi:hypothetical protein
LIPFCSILPSLKFYLLELEGTAKPKSLIATAEIALVEGILFDDFG